MTDTEREPWAADRELDAVGAARAIAECVPELADAEVRLLGSGWDFDAFEADETWVFKFPRRAEEVTRLERELTLLARLDGRLPLPIPRYAWPRLESSSFPYAFSGYRKLPGRPLLGLEPTPERVASIGAALGPFLTALHAVEIDDEMRRVCVGDRPDLDLAGFRQRRRKFLPRIHEWAPANLAERVIAWWDDPSVVPPERVGGARLIHSDLHAEHVLLDAQDEITVTGVIDWGDAELRDPFADFTGVLSWGGVAVMNAVLAAYDGPKDGVEARARFGATQFCVVEADYAHRTGRPELIDRSLAVLAELLA